MSSSDWGKTSLSVKSGYNESYRLGRKVNFNSWLRIVYQTTSTPSYQFHTVNYSEPIIYILLHHPEILHISKIHLVCTYCKDECKITQNHTTANFLYTKKQHTLIMQIRPVIIDIYIYSTLEEKDPFLVWLPKIKWT